MGNLYTAAGQELAILDWVTRNWAAVAIALTLLSLGIFFCQVLARYIKISYNIFVDCPPPLLMGPVDFTPLHGEVVRFRSYDGTSLRGMHLRTRNRANYKGTIVFCHEYRSDMYSCARYARPLIEAGFDVFTFDYRGHGESSLPGKYKPLQWPSDKELGDTLGACGYVEQQLASEGKPAKIGIFGISRGAGSAILAAASDPNIKAIACDSGFCTETTITAFMKRWAHIFARIKLVYENHPEWFWRFLTWMLVHTAQRKLGCRYPSVRRALREMQHRPVLFIHGRKDSYIRVDQSELLHVEAPSPKYAWFVEGAKHNQSVIAQPREYAQRTVAFFRKHLSEEAVASAEITAPKDSQVA
ncbi:MAG: alpha/beta hydrolase [Phycisphaerae bacterium]